MNPFRRAAVVAASLSLAFAVPALADDPWPTEDGDYVQVSMISVKDGHDLHYAQFLAGQWRKNQDFAKAQGWITGYEILINVNRRPGEPDIYLVTRFAEIANKAEGKKRDAAMDAFLQETTAQMQAASGERASYRTQMGSQLLRAQVWKSK